MIRVLGDFGIEIVHEHAQGGFLDPALAGALRAARGTDRPSVRNRRGHFAHDCTSHFAGSARPAHYYSLMNPGSSQLSGEGLTLDDAERILRGEVSELQLAPAARKRIEKSRRCLENLLAADATIYGVNTGFGKLANQRIEPEEILALQENLLRSHAVGMGNLLSIGESRLVLALRIQALAKGYSGVTTELVELLIEMFNRGVVPAIPEQGSVGASGDLAPLAHLALVVMGDG